jgi:diguanylate cyclase (GGDEF)-like protein/PAS domain S-box-containing protein
VAGTMQMNSTKSVTMNEADLLDVVWDALNIARDNKALLLSKRDTIANANALAAELTGRSVSSLIGRSLSELIHVKADTDIWEATINRSASSEIQVEVTRRPLRPPFAHFDVYAIRDLRERRATAEQLERQRSLLTQREQDLESEHAKLEAALSNMFQGLAVFDAEQRLVLANERFAQMYGQALEDVKPGTPLRSIIEHRISAGFYVGTTVDEVLDRMRSRVARQTPSHMTARMGDGRTIAVSIIPRADGGWVTTHQDITEREKLACRLEQQNELLRKREAELALQNARFDAAINNMTQGLCLFDAEKRIIVANRRYGELYGLTPEQVKAGTALKDILEARCSNGFYDNVEGQAFVREALATFGEKVSQVLKLADGRVMSVVRLPMPDGGVLSTHEDITDREQLSARLAQQNERLDAALDNMLQGLAMFDADQRLVVCNRRYADMYGLSSEQVKPGTTVKEILQHRIANGLYHITDSDGFVKSWTGAFGEVSSRIQELADGRIINVTRRSLPNGGRLITHEDITERQHLTKQLEQQHDLLKAQEARLRVQNVQLDAALNNMVQGLAMFDAEYRLVLCNKRYTEIYGLKPEQVTRGTTLRQIIEHRISNGLLSDRSPEEILDGMLRRRAEGSVDQMYNQLSDGRIIAITTQAMGDGGTVTTHQDITDQRRSEAKITHMALHDALTGLPNRVLLHERLDKALARGKRGDILAMHLLDLDHFKRVNDTLGHSAGDRLLQMATDRLRSLMRDTDTIARLGGDEFAIVQVGVSQPTDAASLALRVIETISEPYAVDEHQVVIGASVGIALGPRDGCSPEQLMRSADTALYRAKGEGRGTFCFFERQMDADMQERHALERDLRQAFSKAQFELYFQPIVDLARDDINGFEALLRWHHPERGLVPPDTFIPLAEELGLIIPIGEWVIRQACAIGAQWPEDLKIAVNLSPAQFRSPGLLAVVLSALGSSGLAPERLELEITETVLIHDGKTTLDLLYQLRGLGVRIAMDDFGTGYSSLSYLQSFPFDRIKIDRSFVSDVVASTGSLNIVRAIAGLAKGLGMATTAEGVETREQLAVVTSEGCTEMQGYLFSRPMPVQDVQQLLSKRAASIRPRALVS